MKRITKIIAVVIAAGAAICFSLWILGNLSFGYLFPRTITDRLADPQSVSEIRESGLLLEDGRIVPIPWISRVPGDLPILNDAITQGVEVDSDGRVFGLVQIHHWCGNDPVKEHLARVDLSNLLIAWGAETTVAIPRRILGPSRKQRYTEHGWDISDYLGSEYTVIRLEMEIGAVPAGEGNALPQEAHP